MGMTQAPPCSLRDLVNVLDARIKQLGEQGETVPEPQAEAKPEEPQAEADAPAEEEPSEETAAGGETPAPESEEE